MQQASSIMAAGSQNSIIYRDIAILGIYGLSGRQVIYSGL